MLAVQGGVRSFGIVVELDRPRVREAGAPSNVCALGSRSLKERMTSMSPRSSWSPLTALLRRSPCLGPAIIASLLLLTLAVGSARADKGAGSKGGQSGSSQSPQASQAPPIPLPMERLENCTTDDPWDSVRNLELSKSYNQGKWPDIQTTLAGFIKKISCGKKDHREKLDPSKVAFSVVFLNEALEAPALVRVLVHEPPLEYFGNRVPGFELCDLQLMPDARLFVTSHYQATAGPNPLAAQIPGVLSQIAQGLGGVLAGPKINVVLPPPLCGDASVSKLGSLVVHKVTVPPAFEHLGAAVPQVTVTDQLSSAEILSYMLRSLNSRVSDEDKTFPGIHCSADLGSCGTGVAATGGPMKVLNDEWCKKLTTKESKCLPPVPNTTTKDFGPPDQPTCIGSLEDGVRFLNEVILSAPGLDQSAAQDFAAGLYATYTGLANQAQAGSPPPPTQYAFGRLTRFAFSLGATGIASTSLNRADVGAMSAAEGGQAMRGTRSERRRGLPLRPGHCFTGS
jgi:hypothetical protein